MILSAGKCRQISSVHVKKYENKKEILFLHFEWVVSSVASTHMYRVVSSVGLEHYLDRVGVTGSTPVQPTKKRASVRAGANTSLFFLHSLIHSLRNINS